MFEIGNFLRCNISILVVSHFLCQELSNPKGLQMLQKKKSFKTEVVNCPQPIFFFDQFLPQNLLPSLILRAVRGQTNK